MIARRILFTNDTLAMRGGTVTYIRDLAAALVVRGHQAMAFSTRLSDVADDLRESGIDVVDDLSAIETAPDIIHGHHHIETMMALLRFPGTPAIFVCHGAAPWEETPPKFPRIIRYVGVDDACVDRLTQEQIPSSQVLQILNFVDLARFPPRGPLPPRPARAAVLSNEIAESNVLPAIREACARSGLSLDVFGEASGRVVARPGDVLGEYDVVFAKARTALEAMAAGAAVVLCSYYGMGPMVTTAHLPSLRRLNFGQRLLTTPVTADALLAELARYDAQDAGRVSATIRATASLDAATDRWAALYEDTIEEHRRSGPDDIAAEGRAASAYLRTISDIFKAGFDTKRELERLRASLASSRQTTSRS